MLRAYLDESSKSNDPQHVALTVAGYTFGPDAWEAFESRWRKVLEQHRSPYFHCKEAFHLRGIFSEAKGWSRGRVDALDRDLLGVSPDYEPVGVATIVDLKSFSEIFPS